jgi:hypothetical protein
MKSMMILWLVDGDDGNFVAFEDDNHPDISIDQDALENKEGARQADHSIFNSYEKLLKLQSNLLGLERFSREEKVQIELLQLQLLRDLKAPLKAFSVILNWAAKSNGVVMSSRRAVSLLVKR